ncbi:hypothetical protein [Curtobacterium oceanosedimentum]|uniref:hypothetical protein n=1 Tax=Curtobacterium oceanosedimentum TaxID=465820 RepID=UPI001CE21BBF|nr:hypothetical protein [Curtobacterium oceanosedimentum]MCA5924116.1 hypothetical protein [Curtobacterium oceanosedimentum]
MRSTNLRGVTVACGVLLATIVSVSITAPANASATKAVQTYGLDGITVQGLPRFTNEAALLDYVATNAVSTRLDAETGRIISVAPVTPAEQQARVSVRNTCKSGDAYWAAAATPYTNNCFYGSAGTYTFPRGGTFSRKFYMGSHTARGGWKYGGKQNHTPKQGPGSVATLDAVTQINRGQLY